MIDRRVFMKFSAAAAAACAAPSWLAAASAAPHNLLIASGGKTGILRATWDAAAGELKIAGQAAALDSGIWATRDAVGHIFVACEVGSFDGQPTGGVVSFARQADGSLKELSRGNSAGPGTCQCAIDATGRVLVSVDYGGGSAASFLCKDGRIVRQAWSEKYLNHGPRADRQEKAHAHWASFSPDNRFAYVNDLGGDCIHIYRIDHATAKLARAGVYTAQAGAGPRTLHFHPSLPVAYIVNELDSTIEAAHYDARTGSLKAFQRLAMLTASHAGATRGCDVAITRDARHMYAINRDDNFVLTLGVDLADGHLLELQRGACGGASPRHFALDPEERWLLIANQDSDRISAYARDARTGLLSERSHDFATPAPMCLLFV